MTGGHSPMSPPLGTPLTPITVPCLMTVELVIVRESLVPVCFYCPLIRKNMKIQKKILPNILSWALYVREWEYLLRRPL